MGCTPSKEKRPSPLANDSTSIEGVQLTIEYSSPAVKKRKIWGELVPYGEVWRTGANKATFLTTSADVYIEDKLLLAGRYSIFTIPSDSTWTIIFNEDWDQWGSYNYDIDKDAFRISLIPTVSSFDERMKFYFEEDYIRFDWEELSYRLKIKKK
ncbi:MAG: DUF2911 domain-containing protein [Cyclobacteriaceae bacterium]